MKTVRFVGLLALLSANGCLSLAQSAPLLPMPSLDAEESQRWVVKFAPLSLFDPSNTIQFGIERMLGQHHSLQGEFGYGPQGMNLWRNSTSTRFSNIEIWRGRAEWRYYWRGGPIGNYIAVEGLYKQLNANESGSIGMGCDNGAFGCQYYQLYTSPVLKRVWAAHIKFGRQFRLSPTSNRWLMDFYGGLGIRGNTVERGPQPTGFSYYESVGQFDLFSVNSYPFISISYGLKIGYSF